MPAFDPAEYPPFVGCGSTTTSGYSLCTASTEPSVDALSTTMSSQPPQRLLAQRIKARPQQLQSIPVGDHDGSPRSLRRTSHGPYPRMYPARASCQGRNVMPMASPQALRSEACLGTRAARG